MEIHKNWGKYRIEDIMESRVQQNYTFKLVSYIVTIDKTMGLKVGIIASFLVDYPCHVLIIVRGAAKHSGDVTVHFVCYIFFGKTNLQMLFFITSVLPLFLK